MSELTLTIDFTGVTAASGGIAILEPGLHTAVIEEFRHFSDSGEVLYVYMNTEGQRHRERFNLDNANAKSFLLAFLVSIGKSAEKISGKAKIPFHKFVGKTVYFNYTPPQIDERGSRVEGTYARYVFYPKARYEKMAKYAKVSSEDIQIEEEKSTGNGAGQPTANATAGGEFDFLLE